MVNDTIDYRFRYKNHTKKNVYLWLANPPQINGQRVLREQKSAAKEEIRDPYGNRISYYVLQPGEKVKAAYQLTGYGEIDPDVPLSEKEKNHYLRSTALIPMSDEIKRMAAEHAGDALDDKEKARALFAYIVEQYRYQTPPKARGVEHFLNSRRGDCGEFSFLYAALCRAVGIPCRTMVGAFTSGKHQAHVWNEIYVEGEGWIPVDVSMANIVKKQPWRFWFSNVRTLKWKRYFGQTERQRIVFSIDIEHRPLPPYPHEPKHLDRRRFESFQMADAPFIWGKDALHKNIPYYQPMYLYYEDEHPLNINKLDETLGHWVVEEAAKGKKLTLAAKKISGYALLVLAGLYFLTSWKIVSIAFAFFAFLYSLSFCIRRERPFLFAVPTAYFGITLLLAALGGIAAFLTS